LNGIASLLDKSLLHRETGQHGPTRYAMLETVREYGLERLAASGEDEALRARHARGILKLIDNADRTELDPSWVRVRLLVGAEIHNVRAAWDWARQRDVQAALLLVSALAEWTFHCDTEPEGLRVIDRIIALPDAEAPTVARARALFTGGMLLLISGQFSRAQAFEEESLAISRAVGYGKGEADALLGLGRVARIGSWDEEGARRYFERALAAYRELEDAAGVAYACTLLGDIYLIRGALAQARALYEDALATARQAGFLWAWPMYQLGHIGMLEGDLDCAEAMCRQALPILRRQTNRHLALLTLTVLGQIAIRRGDFVGAHALLAEALANLIQKGVMLTMFEVSLPLADLLMAQGDYRGATRLCRQSWARVNSFRSGWGGYLVRLAGLAETLGMHELLARLVGAIEAAGDATGYPLLDERDAFARLHVQAREHLDAAGFAAAWTRGWEQGFQSIALEALSTLETALGID
jgi:non-specific serine/threonine protein kinase